MILNSKAYIDKVTPGSNFIFLPILSLFFQLVSSVSHIQGNLPFLSHHHTLPLCEHSILVKVNQGLCVFNVKSYFSVFELRVKFDANTLLAKGVLAQ